MGLQSVNNWYGLCLKLVDYGAVYRHKLKCFPYLHVLSNRGTSQGVTPAYRGVTLTYM